MKFWYNNTSTTIAAIAPTIANTFFWFFSNQASVLCAPSSSVLNTSAVVLSSSISCSLFFLGLYPLLLYVAITLDFKVLQKYNIYSYLKGLVFLFFLLIDR